MKMKKIKKVLKVYLIVVGILAHIYILWMGLKWPLLFDRWLYVSHKPQEAQAIVCLCGGIMGNNLPTQRGLQRIYTAVQLYADGWAPKLIFTGRGGSSLSEAEVYAEAAVWLGMPKEAVLVEPLSGSTSEHPDNLLKLDEMRIERSSSLLIVTSPVHSRRAYLCFKKEGYTNFRMVTGYRAHLKKEEAKKDEEVKEDVKVADAEKPTQKKRVEADRALRKSQIKEYKPSQKKYDDFFFRMYQRSGHFWMAAREYAAIVWYWIKGEL